MVKSCVLFLLASIGFCAASEALALDEKLTVHSRTLSEEEFLRGEREAGEPVELSGGLLGPDGDMPLPVVILLHGTDGPGSGSVWNWRRFLHSIGVATLSLDSYTGRGLGEASADQSSFGQFTQIYDTYRAVEALAGHPKIDASRVAVMGFSRGGNGALYSALARFQTSFGPKRGRIVAHLPFYPACNFELKDQLEVTEAPIRIFHGAEDDWAPTAPCRTYIEKLAAAGHDASITEYPGALHAFDNPRAPARVSDSDWQTSRNCLRREENFILVNGATGKPFSYSDACVEYGPTVQYNDAAATAAQAAVKKFLAELFAPR